MPPEQNNIPSGSYPDRWTLVKDILSFQFKLVVDGLRDFILVPVSLVVGLVSLFQPGDRPGMGFYHLLRTGRDTERWINLFRAADRISPERNDASDRSLEDIDSFINKMENFAVNELRTGEMTKQAKDHFDQLLKSIRARKNNKE